MGAGTLPVEAGESVACDVRIANDGTEAVALRLVVGGPAAGYGWVAPQQVTVDAGSEAVVRVGFHIPRGPEPAGRAARLRGHRRSRIRR